MAPDPTRLPERAMVNRLVAATAVALAISIFFASSCAVVPPSVPQEQPAFVPVDTPAVQPVPGELPGSASIAPLPPELTAAEKEQMELDAMYRAIELGDYISAESMLDRLVAGHPENRSYPVLHAAVLLSLQKLDMAREVLTTELSGWPENLEALYALAELERFAGNTKAHRAAIEALIVKDPKNPTAQAAMGDINYEGKSYLKAEANYSAALAVAPQNLDALLGLARVKYRRDDMKGSLELLNKAVEAAPLEPLAYLDRSRVLYQLGRYQECEADLNSAIELAPDSPWNYVERGRLYLDTRRKDLALEDFNASIKLDPDYFLPYVYRAAIFEEAGEDEAALGDYRKASSLYPDYWYSFESMGVLAYRLGNWKEAYESFSKAITYTKNHSEYYVIAALSLMRSGDAKAAKDYASKNLAKIDREKNPLQWLALRLVYDQSDMTSELELGIGAEKGLDLRAGMLFYLGAYWVARDKTELGSRYIGMSYDANRIGTIEYRMAEADLARMSKNK
jgi:tetratricopeptide (TPR) repeat protein